MECDFYFYVDSNSAWEYFIFPSRRELYFVLNEPKRITTRSCSSLFVEFVVGRFLTLFVFRLHCNGFDFLQIWKLLAETLCLSSPFFNMLEFFIMYDSPMNCSAVSENDWCFKTMKIVFLKTWKDFEIAPCCRTQWINSSLTFVDVSKKDFAVVISMTWRYKLDLYTVVFRE